MRVSSVALAFALVVQAYRLLVHQTLSPFADDYGYGLGLILGLGFAASVGAVCAIPVARRSSPSRWLACIAFLTAALLGYAAAAHYHAVFNRLPTGRQIRQLWQPGGLDQSLATHAPLVRTTMEVILCCLVVLLLYRVIQPAINRLVQRFGTTRALVTPFVLLVSINFAAVNAAPGLQRGAQTPFYSATKGWSTIETQAAGGKEPPRVPSRVVAHVQRRLLVPDARAPDPRYPYCRPDPIGADEGFVPRSVILVILESVGSRELELPAMGELRRIARGGTSFERFFASGGQSSQATVSIFSSVPVGTHARLLTRTPLRTMHGFPRDLTSRGYATAYFHGSDLSFEQQHAYLEMAGFEELHEPDPTHIDRIGWGTPDGEMFDQMRDWIERQDGEPYLASLFTISTHDPYALPDGAPTPRSTSAWSRFEASLEYLDRELGRFYDWYLENELPKGTLLVITADHMPILPHPGDPAITTTGELEYRFRMPFIVVGEGVPRARSHVMGGHLDVGPTVLGRLGWTRRDCYQGRDLFESQEGARWIPSLAGEELSLFFVHDGDHRWTFDVTTGGAQLFNWREDPFFRSNLARQAGPVGREVAQFVRDYLHLGGYLNGEDRFAPPPAALKRRRPSVAAPAEPILVSHRGNTAGAGLPDSPRENSLAAIEAAIRAGMGWVEVDLQVTKDGVVVLAHDLDVGEVAIASRTLGDLREHGVELDTLEEALRRFGEEIGFCLEIKRQRFALDRLSVTEGVIRLLPLAKRGAIVDSFSRTTVMQVSRHSDVETAMDLPQKTPSDEWLQYLADHGVDWIYVRHDFATPPLVARAHELGLKVMAYTIDDGRYPPGVDGVITNVAPLELAKRGGKTRR